MTTDIGLPPRTKPKQAPDLHWTDRSGKQPRTLKGDLKTLKGKVFSATAKWEKGRNEAKKKQKEVRGEAEKILAPAKEKIREERKLAGEVMQSVHGTIGIIRAGLDPKNGKTRPYVTSFMLSSVVSWLVGPQVLIALYERIRFGSSTYDWGILNGPGRWFRDTVGMAYESGRTGSLIWAAVLGLLPMVIMFTRNVAAGHLAQGTYQGRLGMFGIKWLTRSAYLVPIIYLTGISYPAQVEAIFGSPWTLEWWQFWVAGLFCSAFYCTMWVFDRVEKGLGLGYTHVLLMTPLASVITGVALYAPGAAW